MNVLFLTLIDFNSIDENNIYTDLLREFVKNGHRVSIVSPTERRKKTKKKLILNSQYQILKLQIGNIQKTNFIEKGISTLLIEYQVLYAIKKYFKKIKFDLVLYSTPPITLLKPINYIKKRDKAKSYLLLKDIFPQGAVDLGVLTYSGLKGVIYRYFRKKEKKLYAVSDFIGCMSQANVDYTLKHNPEIPKEKVEVCPNSIEPVATKLDDNQIKQLRQEYKLPIDKTIFIYGGNLGKPQAVDFIVECLRKCKHIEQGFFIIVGSGTEIYKLKLFEQNEKPKNLLLIDQLAKTDYNKLLMASDVGLIFLDHRFTIPNFPSRILDYMNYSLPIIAATDKNTDIGHIIENNKLGYWCESKDADDFFALSYLLESPSLKNQFGKNSRKFLLSNYTIKHSYDVIIKHFL